MYVKRSKNVSYYCYHHLPFPPPPPTLLHTLRHLHPPSRPTRFNYFMESYSLSSLILPLLEFAGWMGASRLRETHLSRGVSKAVCSFPMDISLGPEPLYQFFIKTSYFLFMTLAGSLKTALPVGDTSKAFSRFLSSC